MMVAVPNSQIGNAVGDVFQMELANAVITGDSARVHNLFYKLLRKSALFGLLPFGAVAVLGPLLVPLIFGVEWREAGIAAASVSKANWPNMRCRDQHERLPWHSVCKHGR